MDLATHIAALLERLLLIVLLIVIIWKQSKRG